MWTPTHFTHASHSKWALISAIESLTLFWESFWNFVTGIYFKVLCDLKGYSVAIEPIYRAEKCNYTLEQQRPRTYPTCCRTKLVSGLNPQNMKL